MDYFLAKRGFVQTGAFLLNYCTLEASFSWGSFCHFSEEATFEIEAPMIVSKSFANSLDLEIREEAFFSIFGNQFP